MGNRFLCKKELRVRVSPCPQPYVPCAQKDIGSSWLATLLQVGGVTVALRSPKALVRVQIPIDLPIS
jgi:hypothetical protein